MEIALTPARFASLAVLELLEYRQETSQSYASRHPDPQRTTGRCRIASWTPPKGRCSSYGAPREQARSKLTCGNARVKIITPEETVTWAGNFDPVFSVERGG